MLNNCLDIIDSVLPGKECESLHKCYNCDVPLKDEEAILLREMLKKPPEIEQDIKPTLFYIGGYVAFKHEEHRDELDHQMCF